VSSQPLSDGCITAGVAFNHFGKTVAHATEVNVLLTIISWALKCVSSSNESVDRIRTQAVARPSRESNGKRYNFRTKFVRFASNLSGK